MRKDGFVILLSEHECYDELIKEFSDLDTIFLYSLWMGYIDKEIGKGAYNEKLADFCRRHNAIEMHTSGHAYPEFIEQVKEAVGAEEIITIHMEKKV